MNDKRPEPGTEEFREWLRKKLQPTADEMAKQGPTDFEERGVLSGGPETTRKSDAEAFPDELDEHTPEERRKALKVHKGDSKKKKD